MAETHQLYFANLAKAEISDASFAAGTTTLNVTAGQGTRLGTAPFRAILWNSTDYNDPADAYWESPSQAEIVECTTRSTDALTVTRGLEGTSGITSIAGKTYKIAVVLTADVIGSIPQVYNVKHYGAKGDDDGAQGGTDDSTAIQAAITALATTGGILYFPPSYYRCDSPLDFSSVTVGVHILGAGAGASRIYGYGANDNIIKATSGGAASGFEISNIGIFGEQTQPIALIEIQQRNSVFIHDCILFAAQYQIYCTNSVGHVCIRDNVFGWKVSPSPAANSRCIYIRDGSLYSITGNSFENNHTNITCIVLGSVTSGSLNQITIADNKINGTSGSFLQIGVTGSAVATYNDITVCGNAIYGINGYLISHTIASHVVNCLVFSNNTAYGSGTNSMFNITSSMTRSKLDCANHRNFKASGSGLGLYSGLDSASTLIYPIHSLKQLGFENNLRVLGIYCSPTSYSSGSGTLAIDWENGFDSHTTLTENITTLTLSNPLLGQRYKIVIKQGGSGGYTIDWTGNGIVWTSDGAPNLGAMSTGQVIHVMLSYDEAGVYRGDYSKVYAS